MNKDKVLELAQKADVWVAGQTPYQEQLERFAALIEAEIFGDAEPVLYQYRMKPSYDEKFPWCNWSACSKETYNQYKEKHAWGDWIYESRILYSQPTSEITDQLMSIIDLYEKALLTTFPQGASDEVFEYWNKARKALNKIKE